MLPVSVSSAQIRETFHLDQSVNLDVTFELKVPTLADEHKAGGDAASKPMHATSQHEEPLFVTACPLCQPCICCCASVACCPFLVCPDQKVYLKGFHTFEAASTVAAICAAKRMARKTVQSAPGNAGLSTAGAAAAGAAATAKDTDGSTTPPATAAVGGSGTRPTSAGGSSGGGGSSGAGAMPLGARELQRCRSASPPTLLDPLLELEQEPTLQMEPNLLATTSQQLTSSMPRPRFASVPSLLINTAPAAASYAVASASVPSGGGARASCERPQQQPREHATVLAALPALDMIALANNTSLSEPGTASERAPVCPRGAGPASPLVCSAAGAQDHQGRHEGRQEQQGHGLQEEASVPRNKSFGKMISQKFRSFFGMASNASSDTRNGNRSGSHGSS